MKFEEVLPFYRNGEKIEYYNSREDKWIILPEIGSSHETVEITFLMYGDFRRTLQKTYEEEINKIKKDIQKETEMRMISKFIGDMKALHGIIRLINITDINDILYRIGELCEMYSSNFDIKWSNKEGEK
jgi:hypothetical protein